VSAAAAVARMSDQEQGAAYLALLSQLDEDYKANAWLWLTEQVWTQDEASQQIRRWPDKPYLQELCAFIEAEPMLALPKSRRVMATWLVAGWCTHRARYFPHNAIFIQSEVEGKAAFVVDQRCVFIEDHLEEPRLRRPYHAVRTHDGAIGRVTYNATGSYLLAIAEGGEKMRTFTPSVLVLDESEFQPRGHQALVAALSMVEKKAKIILLSSSNGPIGVMAGICREAGFRRWTG
jgi:hypothetical protein